MNKSVKKLFSILAVFCAVVLALSACAPGSSDNVNNKPATSSSANTSGSAAAPAAKLDPYTIDYAMLCNGPYPKMSDIDAALSKIMTEKFNATLKTTMIGWGDWAAKVTTRLAAGDKIDVCFTADWYGYSRDVAQGLFSPLNDLLTKDAPETVASLGDQFVKGSQIDGINYGVPTEKELLVPGGLVFNKDLVDKYGFDITKVKTEQDLEPMLQKIKENEPNVIPYLFDGNAYNLSYLSPASDFGDAIVNDDGKDDTVAWKYAEPAFVEHIKLMRKWYQAGYIHQDSGLDSFKYTDRIIATGYFCAPQPLKGNNIKADELSAQDTSGKLHLVEQRTANMFTHSGDCGGSMLAIPVTSKDPDRAMMFINLIHQDKAAVNLLAWGIEGVNYKKVEGKDNVVSIVPDNGYTNQVLLWTLGSQFLHFIGEKENPQKMELLKNYAKEGQPSNLLGFRYVPDAITNEKAAYDNIAKQYGTPLLVGRVDPDTELPKFTADAKAAGLDKILTDIQSKIDAWKAKK